LPLELTLVPGPRRRQKIAALRLVRWSAAVVLLWGAAQAGLIIGALP
jgi:hypothetical protein